VLCNPARFTNRLTHSIAIQIVEMPVLLQSRSLVLVTLDAFLHCSDETISDFSDCMLFDSWGTTHFCDGTSFLSRPTMFVAHAAVQGTYLALHAQHAIRIDLGIVPNGPGTSSLSVKGQCIAKCGSSTRQTVCTAIRAA